MISIEDETYLVSLRRFALEEAGRVAAGTDAATVLAAARLYYAWLIDDEPAPILKAA